MVLLKVNITSPPMIILIIGNKKAFLQFCCGSELPTQYWHNNERTFLNIGTVEEHEDYLKFVWVDKRLQNETF